MSQSETAEQKKKHQCREEQQQLPTADDVRHGNDQQEKSKALEKLRQWRARISTGSMDQILPGLFVGGLREATNVPLLSENGIRAVVSVHGFSRECHFGPGIAVLRLSLSDSSGENVLQYFPTVNSFVHSHRLKNENVLVHCLAGVSRSVCLCLAYLMTVTNLDYPNALEFVCHRHFCAEPNFGFKMQLIKFGQQFVQFERRRLFAEFANFSAQMHEQFRNDCICTNSLFICGSSEVMNFDDNNGTKQRHEDEKEAKSQQNDAEEFGGENWQRKSAKGKTAESSSRRSIGLTSSILVASPADKTSASSSSSASPRSELK